MIRHTRILIPVLLFAALVAVIGCGKKLPPALPAPPPVVASAAEITAAAPTARLVASPGAVLAGDPVQLSWSSTNATSATLEGIGEVPVKGAKNVAPAESMSYRLVVKGDGGMAEATVYVTVNHPRATEAPIAAAPTVSLEEAFQTNVKDVFYPYDSYSLTEEAQATLSQDANFMVNHPDAKILIGGYCDERGSNEYNLALGQNRADAVRKALMNAGVSTLRIRILSYGKEKPFCTESTEECWQKNRRAGFTLDR